jgi:amino acid transporter
MFDGPTAEPRRTQDGEFRAHLGLWDAVSIIVGIVIGATIYKSPQLIMSNVSSPTVGLLAWGLGGVLSLIGALCYAELATTYPRSGGDYVYLSRAFGDWCGFLFGWAQLAVVLTASMAMMAFVFGDYAVRVWAPPDTVVPAELRTEETSLRAALEAQETKLDDSSEWQALQSRIRPYNSRRELWIAGFAAAAVIVLALTNMLGVVLGKVTQNLLSLVKVLGLGAIVYAGFKYGSQDVFQGLPEPPKVTSFGTAMIFVLYAYGGWNDAAFVAAEVRNRRNILRALLLGTAIITVIYLAVNIAYLSALGFEKMRASNTVAAEVGQMALQDRGSLAISLLVMVSVLGAINGLTYTGSRVYTTLGADHSLFALLGRWSPRFGSPVWALMIQAAVTLAMIVAVGTPFGRDAIDWCVTSVQLDPMPWDRYFGGFDTLLSGTAPVFWGFFLLSGLSLFALRQRDPHIERPFRVPLFPYLPLIFCAYCAYMLYSAIDYAKWISLIGALPLAVGLVLYGLSHLQSGSEFPPSTSGAEAAYDPELPTSR